MSTEPGIVISRVAGEQLALLLARMRDRLHDELDDGQRHLMAELVDDPQHRDEAGWTGTVQELEAELRAALRVPTEPSLQVIGSQLEQAIAGVTGLRGYNAMAIALDLFEAMRGRSRWDEPTEPTELVIWLMVILAHGESERATRIASVSAHLARVLRMADPERFQRELVIEAHARAQSAANLLQPLARFCAPASVRESWTWGER